MKHFINSLAWLAILACLSGVCFLVMFFNTPSGDTEALKFNLLAYFTLTFVGMLLLGLYSTLESWWMGYSFRRKCERKFGRPYSFSV